MKERNSPLSPPLFITVAEYEEFQKPDLFVPRTWAETPLGGTGRTVPRLVKLDSQLKSQLIEVADETKNSFVCNCISVREGDGMSWAAEAVSAKILKDFGKLTLWALSNTLTTDSLPVISSLIGLNSFLGLAAANGVARSSVSFISLRRWMTPLIIVMAVAIGTAINIVTTIQKSKFPGTNQTIGQLFSDWKFYAVNLGLSLLGLVSQRVATRQATNPKSKAIESLVDQLSSNDVLESRDFDRFVDALARQMQTGKFPRVVIIDNFEHLDETTRRVIDRYFQKYSEARRGSELWFIFQKQDGARFSNLALEHEAGYGFRKTQFFEQMVLNDEEKKALVSLINRPEDALEYITVKRITHAKAQDDEQSEAFFRAYRKDHPQEPTYGGLEFLFLLSLTADTIFLTQKFIVKNLPVKSGLRADVLSRFLSGTKLRRDEFRSAWSEIQQRFKTMLISEPDVDSLKLRVIPERTDVLEAMADELKLPKARLGHVFWALFWYDKLQNHPLQAIWMRKLTEHLLKADAKDIQEDQAYVNVLGRLFDAMLFAVEGCMKACLFQNIRALLETALNLLNGDLEKNDVNNKRLYKLLRKCWEAYSVLGDEEILKFILEIHDTTQAQMQVKVGDDRLSLEKLFFESIPLAPQNRKRFKPGFFARTYGREAASEAMSDYACVRSAWLALASGYRVESDVSGFVTALVLSDSIIQQIAGDTFDRLNSVSDESIRVTDVMTLSLSLWCSALRFNPAVLNTRHNAMMARMPAAPFATLNLPGREMLTDGLMMADLFRDFSSLIEAAEDAVLLADKVKRGAAGQSPGSTSSDYLMNALAKELCAISLASVLVANSLRGIPVEDQQLKRINDLIRISNDFLDYTLPEVSEPEDLDSPELLNKVDSLMRLCGIISSDFGLDRLRDFMNIRRIYFNAVCLPASPNNFLAYNSLLRSVGQIINARDFSGIMANLAISESFESAEELAVYYLIHAAEIGLSDTFGRQMKNQLCLAAVLESHIYDYNLDIFITYLIAEVAGRQSLLRRFLDTLPEWKIEGTLLKLLNVSNRASNPADGKRIVESLNLFVSGIVPGQVKQEAESLLEVFTTRERIEKGETINHPEVLKAWEGRRALWLYPWILNMLIRNGYSAPKAYQEGLALLKDRNPEKDDYNTHFLLSLTLAWEFINASRANGEQQLLASYLKEGIKKWETHSSAETNLQVYQVLYKMDPRNQSYLSEIQRWTLNKMEADHLKRLPRLLGEGRFFLVFKYYFESMEFWGLTTDISAADLVAKLNVAPETKQKLAGDWKASGGIVPPPLSKQGNMSVVSSSFISLGSYIFSAPIYENSAFDAERHSFDERARSKIPDLFGMIMNLPELPQSIKDLMRNHSQRLVTYTLPEDDQDSDLEAES